MGKKIEKVKEHIKKHKETYIAGSICLATGIIVGVVVRSKPNKIVNNVAPVISPVFNNTVTNVNFGGYSHKIVKCDQTNEVWETVKDAAKAAGVSTCKMSKHLNRHMEHINNKTYSIIGVGTAS